MEDRPYDQMTDAAGTATLEQQEKQSNLSERPAGYAEIKPPRHKLAPFDPTRSDWPSWILTITFTLLLILGLADRLGLLPLFSPPLRLLLAWGWLIMSPGFFLTRLMGWGKGLLPSEILAVSAAVGLAVVGLLGWVASICGIALSWLPVLSAAVSVGAAVIGLNHPPPDKPEPYRRSPRTYSGLLLVGALLISVVLFRVGGTLYYPEDGLGHVAIINAAETQDTMSPSSVWYAEGEVPNPDPRLSAFHGVLASLASESHMEPADLWLLMPGVMGPFLFLAFGTFVRSLLPSGSVWMAACVLFLLGFGGLDPRGMRVISDPIYASFILFWISVSFFVKAMRGRSPRVPVVAAFLGGMTALMHLYGIIQLTAAYAAFAVGALLLRRQRGRWALPAAGTAVLSCVLAAPYLAYRFFTAWHPANEANFLPQGVLWLGDHSFVISPGMALSWLGFAGVASFFFLPRLIRGARNDPGLLFLAATMLFSLAVVANPLVLPLLYHALSYLSVRLVYLTPHLVVLAWGGWEMAKLIRHGPRRALAALALILLAALFWPTARLRANYLGPSVWEEEPASLRVREILSLLDDPRLGRGAEGPLVFASDALTSYAIPAYTSYRVTAIPAEHASPNDPDPIGRLRAAESILSPHVGIAETLTLLRQHKVDMILLNKMHTHYYEGYEYSILPGDLPLTRAKFDALPEVFHLRWDIPQFTLYQVSPEAIEAALRERDRLAVPLIPPPVLSEAEVDALPGSSVLAAFPAGLSVVHFALSPTVVRPGETVQVDCVWRREIPQVSDGSEPGWWVYLRANTGYERGRGYADGWSKLYRFIQERRAKEKYRFRVRHTPTGGSYPTYRWKPGELVRDSWSFVVPRGMASGDYTIELALVPSQVVWTFGVRDYLNDKDRFSGYPMGELTIDNPRRPPRPSSSGGVD